MANNIIHIFLLLTFFLQLLHARENQFFYKFPRETDQQHHQQPDFIPQTKDYGLHRPSTTTNGGGAADKLAVSTFPETYNTDAYETTYTENNKYNGDDNTMYNNQKQERFYRHLPTATNGGRGDVTLPESYNPVAYTTPIHAKDSYQTTDSKMAGAYDYSRGDSYKSRGYYEYGNNNDNSHNPRGYYGHYGNSYNPRYNSNAGVEEKEEYVSNP